MKGKPPVIGASRVLFADSFYAAKSVLWGRHEGEATFRDGEILVLMSMDPDAPLTQRGFKELRAKEEALKQRALNSTDEAAFKKIINELLLIDSQRKSLPRGIVIHPAVAGRELSWSAARVDFWFNQMDGLSKEAAAINGGHRMPENLRQLPISNANTWQFFEQDSVIRLGEVEGRARRLRVVSKRLEGTGENSRSHFGISMFAISRIAPPDSERVEDGVFRLPRLERAIQPLLDWLAINHHDFMRLNDFSEAFSLLRWLRSKQTAVTIIDMDGEGKALATPDRVVLDRGPGVGPQ